MESKYRINAKGRQYISTPNRDFHGRVSANYFKKLILLFVIENGSYRPSIFKEYVETLNILTDADVEYMATRQYVEWKHNIDSAKDQLEKQHGLLIKAGDGSFVIPAGKVSEGRDVAEALKQITLFAWPQRAEKIENVNGNEQP